MARRLPPLNALRAFEAAARHGSFAKAADELAVTPAAISQQIRLLEADLGVTLFRRLPRGLVVTEAARRSLPELGKAFAYLQRAVEGVRGDSLAGPLVISAIPSFAARWVAPRLGSFITAYPEIEVTLRTELRNADFAREVDERSIPHELDLLRTTVHTANGCYRGQETIARVHNLGRPPRRLAFLHLDGSGHTLPDVGADVLLGDKVVGRVTSRARHHEDGPIALAVLKRNTDDAADLLVTPDVAAAQTVVVPR